MILEIGLGISLVVGTVALVKSWERSAEVDVLHRRVDMLEDDKDANNLRLNTHRNELNELNRENKRRRFQIFELQKEIEHLNTLSKVTEVKVKEPFESILKRKIEEEKAKGRSIPDRGHGFTNAPDNGGLNAPVARISQDREAYDPLFFGSIGPVPTFTYDELPEPETKHRGAEPSNLGGDQPSHSHDSGSSHSSHSSYDHGSSHSSYDSGSSSYDSGSSYSDSGSSSYSD